MFVRGGGIEAFSVEAALRLFVGEGMLCLRCPAGGSYKPKRGYVCSRGRMLCLSAGCCCILSMGDRIGWGGLWGGCWAWSKVKERRKEFF